MPVLLLAGSPPQLPRLTAVQASSPRPLAPSQIELKPSLPLETRKSCCRCREFYQRACSLLRWAVYRYLACSSSDFCYYLVSASVSQCLQTRTTTNARVFKALSLRSSRRGRRAQPSRLIRRRQCNLLHTFPPCHRMRTQDLCRMWIWRGKDIVQAHRGRCCMSKATTRFATSTASLKVSRRCQVTPVAVLSIRTLLLFHLLYRHHRLQMARRIPFGCLFCHQTRTLITWPSVSNTIWAASTATLQC